MANVRLNTEEIRIVTCSLKRFISFLQACRERCWEREIESGNPIYKREFNKMDSTYADWIKEVKDTLDHIVDETREERP